MSRAMLKKLSVTLLAAGLVATGCKKPAADKKPVEKKKAPVEKKAPPPAPAKSANADCFAPWSTEGASKEVAVGDRKFTVGGTKMVESTTDEDKKAVLGVLANIKEDTPENLKNIEQFLAFFMEKKVDAIVVAGDVGETKTQIENALMPIAAKGLPTFVVIGNREKKSDFNQAVDAVAAKHSNVVNLNQVRLAAMDDVALVSVPGYYDKAYIHATDGCHYSADDVAKTQKIVESAGKTVVLVSHGPPKQSGAEALDRTLEQANVGDPALAKLIGDANVKFGIFSNIQEAGGRATDATGEKLLSANEPHDMLFLNPGATDSVSWKMNDGTRSVGMAAVMTVEGGKAWFEVKRIEDKDS